MRESCFISWLYLFVKTSAGAFAQVESSKLTNAFEVAVDACRNGVEST